MAIRTTHLRFAQQAEQLSAFHKIHHHVQVFRILERPPQRDEERMLHFLEHSPFIVGVLDLLHLDDLLLFEHFHRIIPMVVIRLYQVHSAEAPGPQRPLQSEVGQGVLPSGLSDGR